MVQTEKIWASPNLPTLPLVARQLLDLVRNPETVINDVIQIIKVDPAICAKLIKAANSSYFGLRHEVKTIERAVPMLGTTSATTLTLSFALTDDSLNKSPLAPYYQNYWKQSIVQAAAAEMYATKHTDRDPSEFFLLGLLLDIGRLAMLKAIPAEYGQLLATLDNFMQPLAEQEASMLGCQHANIGARLLQSWKIPDPLIHAVELHEASEEDLAELESHPDFLPLSIAAFAGAIGEYLCGPAKGKSLQRIRAIGNRWLSLNNEQLDNYLHDCNLRIEQTGDLFLVNMSGVQSSTELMLQANEQLVQLALQAQAVNTQAELRNAELAREKLRLEESNRILQAKAIHDPLTNLYNRGFFEETLIKETHRCGRQAAPLAIIMADIDHFKRINDTYGHLCGDSILIQVAQRLRSSIRTSGTLARYGGEEFVILVHKPTEKGLAILSERIRDSIASSPVEFDGHRIPLTISLGTALAIPGRGEKNIGQRLLVTADQALYAAKAAGRNQVSSASLISEDDRKLNQLVTSQKFSRWLVQHQLLDIATVSRAMLEVPLTALRIGEIAQNMGLLTDQQVATILQTQEAMDERSGRIAIRLGYLTIEQLATILATQHENPRELTSAIIRLGLLAPESATAALESYLLSLGSVVAPAKST